MTTLLSFTRFLTSNTIFVVLFVPVLGSLTWGLRGSCLEVSPWRLEIDYHQIIQSTWRRSNPCPLSKCVQQELICADYRLLVWLCTTARWLCGILHLALVPVVFHRDANHQACAGGMIKCHTAPSLLALSLRKTFLTHRVKRPRVCSYTEQPEVRRTTAPPTGHTTKDNNIQWADIGQNVSAQYYVEHASNALNVLIQATYCTCCTIKYSLQKT